MQPVFVRQQSFKLFMYMINKIEPRTLPCGTPLVTLKKEDKTLVTYPSSKDLNHLFNTSSNCEQID